jgi:hypothetical protein
VATEMELASPARFAHLSLPACVHLGGNICLRTTSMFNSIATASPTPRDVKRFLSAMSSHSPQSQADDSSQAKVLGIQESGKAAPSPFHETEFANGQFQRTPLLPPVLSN